MSLIHDQKWRTDDCYRDDRNSCSNARYVEVPSHESPHDRIPAQHRRPRRCPLTRAKLNSGLLTTYGPGLHGPRSWMSSTYGRIVRTRTRRWAITHVCNETDTIRPHGDQAQPPLVPVLTALRVTPPSGTLHTHATIRTRVRLTASVHLQAIFRIRWPSEAPVLRRPGPGPGRQMPRPRFTP
jgi:hypothetical protein